MIHGLFYIVAGALFAVYAVDLSWLIAVSLWARAQEVRSLCQPYDAAKHSPEARASKGSWLTFSGKKQQKAAKSPPSEAGSGSEMGAIGATLDRDSGSTSGRSASAEPSSPQENSSSGSSDAGSSSPQVTVKLSSLEHPLRQGLTKFVHGLDLSQGIPTRDDEWPLPVSEYPNVLVQLPMYNEEAHAAIVVERMCAMAWPRSRLLIQILDDSTREDIRARVDAAAARMVEDGHPVVVIRRTNRQGYKAGAMSDALKAVAHLDYKYVAVFDADFKPPADFLLEMVAPLEARPDLGFTQAKWLNPYHNFLTWVQSKALAFHFDVEQRSRSYLRTFFNFNGTAGVWRIKAIDEAGGWHSDTVVEDMDLSLRAFLADWKGLYVPHVGADNENPDDLPTYRTQQYRWLCGPMQILTKAFSHIYKAKDMPWHLRLDCYYFFFRYILFGLLVLVALAVPPMVLWIEPWQWLWPEIFFMVSVNMGLVLYLCTTPFTIPFMLFSVAFGYFRIYAMAGGLLGSKKSKSWKVTKKKGAPVESASRVSLWQRAKDAVASIGWPYALEFVLFVYYAALTALCFAGVGLDRPSWMVGGYTCIMAIVFLLASFGEVFL